MTAIIDENGIKIQYPENWRRHDLPTNIKPFEISIESPSGTIWNLHVMSPTSDPEFLVQQMLEEFRKNYEDVEVNGTNELVENTELMGFDLNFFYLDLLIEVRIRHFSTLEHSFVLMIQAESRDFDREQLVLQAITISLFRNLSHR
ncbi:MAG TPA: hypothetical protein PKD64_04870 [Pirellulaceae bacterium]|nr:hypothetical protein [Pirellulaceae bacterium]HMO91507.1 hypothetical protein [Pirellulaceae bacterium]HMP70980.1 hypothetical protein [Pirellulaceae bacterium]